MPLKKSFGFILLELIVVVSVIAVMIAIAIPLSMKVIEFSRSTEALAVLAPVRKALERCYMTKNENLTRCRGFDVLILDDPADAPNAHFTYV